MTRIAAPPALEDHQRRAAAFAHLHDTPALVLANAWDAASAGIVAAAGAAAVATTSAGVAWALGAPDGDAVDRVLALQAIGRIVATVDVPVTADIETGYGATDDQLAQTILGVLDAGAVGINIEDSGFAPLRPIAEQAERLRVVRSTADSAGRSLFVNARIDTYLMQAGDPDDRFAETLRRSHAYLEAGANGVFVPGLLDLQVLRELVAEVPAPVNVLAGFGGPTVAELRDIGVRRVSLGSAVAQAAYDLVGRAVREVLDTGTYETLARALDYGELNRLVGTRASALG